MPLLESFRKARRIVPFMIGLEVAGGFGGPNMPPQSMQVERKEQERDELKKKMKNMLKEIVEGKLFYTEENGANSFFTSHLDGDFVLADSDKILESPGDYFRLMFDGPDGMFYCVNYADGSIVGSAMSSSKPKQPGFFYKSSEEMSSGVLFGGKFLILPDKDSGAYIKDSLDELELKESMSKIPSLKDMREELAENTARVKEMQRISRESSEAAERSRVEREKRKEEEAKLLPLIREKVAEFIKTGALTEQEDESYSRRVQKGRVTVEGKNFIIIYNKDMGFSTIAVERVFDNGREPLTVLQIVFGEDGDNSWPDFTETSSESYEQGDYEPGYYKKIFGLE